MRDKVGISVSLTRYISLWVFACVSLPILFGSAPDVLAQSATKNLRPNSLTEKWILQKVANGEEAHLEQAFPKRDDRILSGSFIEHLLTNSIQGVKVSRRGVHIYDAVVSDPIDLQNEEIPYTFTLSNCLFENEVVFRNAHIKGDMNADKSRFTEYVDFEDIELEGDAFFRHAVFESRVNFLGAHIIKYLEFDNTQFTNTQNGVDFENVQVEMNAFFRNVVFKGQANFSSMYVNKSASFSGSVFEDSVTFDIAEIKKDFIVDAAQFKNTEKEINFFALKVDGNAIFSNSLFAGGLFLAKANIGGNIDLANVRATNPKKEKTLSGLRADGIMFDGAQFVAPYWLNGMSYRLISYNMEEEALLSFINNSNYKSDVYSTLESHYQRMGNIYAARDVYVAGKNRERSGTFSKAPLRYVWNWVQYITTAYGKNLARALIWGLLFIIMGCIVFWREAGMETQDRNDAERYAGRYHPIWYSLATFLPIIDLPDATIWTPRIERKLARLYLRLHIILGYLLIPIGLAAWTGIIK